MPTVTGYILLGLAFGVSLLKIIPKDLNLKLTWLIEFALLLVAFNVGMELRIDTFRRLGSCLLYTSPSPRDRQKSRMPSSA